MPSSKFRREMFASQTSEVLLCRMVVDPGDGSDIIYAVNNSEAIDIGGQEYASCVSDGLVDQ